MFLPPLALSLSTMRSKAVRSQLATTVSGVFIASRSCGRIFGPAATSLSQAARAAGDATVLLWATASMSLKSFAVESSAAAKAAEIKTRQQDSTSWRDIEKLLGGVGQSVDCPARGV